MKLGQQLSSINTVNGKIGTGVTVGNELPTETKDGDKITGGKFTVLWFEHSHGAKGNNRKSIKHLKRRMIRITDGNRDRADQIIEQVSQIAGSIKTDFG